MALPDQSLPTPLFSYGDYRQWQGDERWELIEGEALAMSPAPSRRHQQVVLGLAAQIKGFLDRVSGPCEVNIAPFDVRLPRADEADDDVMTVVQPDIAVVCDPSKLDDAGCRGVPDWMVEVLSPSTTVRDQVAKRDLYARHGVREYWIIHPTAHLLTRYRLDDSGSRWRPTEVEEARGQTSSAVLAGFEVDWRRVFPLGDD